MAIDRAHSGPALKPRSILTHGGMGLATALIAYALALTPAEAQSPTLTEIIFDLPCRDLVGATAEDALTQNTVVGSIFAGFITARAPEEDARAMLADIYNQSILLGTACEFGDGSLYEAMSVVVEGYLAGN